VKQKKKQQSVNANKIAVIDFETDPFLHGRVPKPFCAGFYDGAQYKYFWGDDCVVALMYFLDRYPVPLLIYAHNGGKFDFHFLLDYLDNPIRIIARRIAQAACGKHTFRDSYSAIPIPLSAYMKTYISYEKFETENRELHRVEIIDYLKDDCIFLYNLIEGFCTRFDRALTIGGASIKQLRDLHEFDAGNSSHDARFRPYFFGGRVQCFEYGEIHGDFKIYDVNSMYPAVMKNYDHPTGKKYLSVNNSRMDKHGNIVGIADAKFYFAKVHATLKDGGLPMREKTGLNFGFKTGIFETTSHELKTLIKHKCIEVHKVITAHASYETINFGEFVDKFSREKIDAKTRGDKAGEIFAKLILNSAYGKFGQNPEHYRDYLLNEGMPEPALDWQFCADFGTVQLFEKPISAHSYYDVAVGASITSAARSVLMDALLKSTRPIYCDTDSIICEKLEGVEFDDKKLGAWKFEGDLDTIAVAGKKLYAGFKNGECIKVASKGVRLEGKDILKVARGEKANWKSEAPSFSLLKPPSFMDRDIERIFK
jgi:DNA polymerase type B, organellar and viral